MMSNVKDILVDGFRTTWGVMYTNIYVICSPNIFNSDFMTSNIQREGHPGVHVWSSAPPGKWYFSLLFWATHISNIQCAVDPLGFLNGKQLDKTSHCFSVVFNEPGSCCPAGGHFWAESCSPPGGHKYQFSISIAVWTFNPDWDKSIINVVHPL